MPQRINLYRAFTTVRRTLTHPRAELSSLRAASAAAMAMSATPAIRYTDALPTASAVDASPGLAAPKKMQPPPAYITNIHHLFARYDKQGFTQEQVRVAAYLVCHEDARFSDNPSSYLASVRTYKCNPQRVQDFAALPEARRQQLRKAIADDMVGLTFRAPARFSVGATHFEQRYAHTHVEAGPNNRWTWSLREGYTLSSEVAKKDDKSINKHSLAHCANGGYVAADHTLLAWRSARCDTPHKLEENLVGSCCASLACAQGDKSRARGWQKVGNGWEYQPVLVTAMDKSMVKHLFELIRSLFFGEKRTERARLRALNSACKTMFEKSERTGRYYDIDVQGRRERVFIKPPQIVNVVLSGRSKHANVLRSTRSDNRIAAAKLGENLVEQLRLREEDDDADTVEAFLHTPAEQMANKLQDSAYRERVGAMRPGLRLAVEWLHLTLAKSTLDGNDLTQRTDPGVEVLLFKHMCDEANLAASVGCKSGVDRTPVFCALFSAAHAYEALHHEPFDPLTVPDGSQPQTDMHALFTQFADTLAKPVVDLIRGVDGRIQWADHPVARHWYKGNQLRMTRAKSSDESRDGSPTPSPASA